MTTFSTCEGNLKRPEKAVAVSVDLHYLQTESLARESLPRKFDCMLVAAIKLLEMVRDHELGGGPEKLSVRWLSFRQKRFESWVIGPVANRQDFVLVRSRY